MMSELEDVDLGRDETPSTEQQRPSRLTRRAWWAFAGLPVSFVAAALLGGWLITLQGYDPDAEGSLRSQALHRTLPVGSGTGPHRPNTGIGNLTNDA